ncbi:uncharacterized protein LOC113393496 [Vanessa tameamea]|uniref:Uncharacterized protein LOC113393496 n=1 Tax=Vanessa tameamea TaxID=334116 RepID=A0A8B8HMW1_VANTA
MASKEDKHEVPGCSRIIMKKGDISRKHKKNFVRACELESEKAYLNYTERLQILFLPNCSTNFNCKHYSKKKLQIQQISPRVINSIQTEISDNMWYEALDISYLCITPKQYLTANVLRDIVEIMLNAHEDVSSKYSITHLISKCEQVLALHFRMHPPCGLHDDILSLYNSFLMGPMTSASNTNNKKHSTRNDHGCDKGIIEYCLNRLEYEISSESKDGPLVNKDNIIPDNLKGSLKGLHYEKEYLEMYELLERTERIERLMAVLHSTIELIQFNLFILRSRELRQNILMHNLFLPVSPFYQVQKISKQIIKLFAYFVHLNYPAEHIKIMSIWLNVAIETHMYTAYNRNCNFSHLGLFGNNFAEEINTVISDLPHESIIKILSKIHPNYMKREVGFLYCKKYLNYVEEDIMNILITFLETSKWKDFPKSDSENLLKRLNIVESTPKNIMNHLSKICKNKSVMSNNNMSYPKFQSPDESEINQDIIISALYISLNAYLESYNVQNVNATLEKMNNSEIVLERKQISEYYITPELIKIYKNIYQLLPKVILILNDLKKNNRLPEQFKVFERLFTFDLIEEPK